MERDFNGYMPPFMDYGMPPFGAPQDTKYLCMQMDYKIKCKEYEKFCRSENNSSAQRHERKIE